MAVNPVKAGVGIHSHNKHITDFFLRNVEIRNISFQDPEASVEKMILLHKAVMKTDPTNMKECSSGKEQMSRDVLYCFKPERNPKLRIELFTKANMNDCI